MTEQPAGTVTLLFTDIEGSTRLLDELGADRYREALAEHRRLLRGAFEAHGGYEVGEEGDSFFIAFSSATAGLAAAQEGQTALTQGPISVRMGLHTGEPLVDPPKYVGMDVHRAARIMAAGHGGQVLVSGTTATLVGGEFDLRDLGPHRLKDLTAAEHLFQLGGGDFPALKSLRQTNLPIQATPLVGREREIEELVGYVREPDMRLLTLTGVGGTGKTRLALQSAAELSEDFRDGVWFVDLAPLRDPALVEQTIATTIGADDLTEHLRSKEALLVLDNFEQVVDAVAVVSTIVGGCPHTRLLVTSRVALRIGGERLYPVSPLSQEEAVELFAERARRVQPTFAPNGAVGEICERLDRLPLAIELAAARVRVLTPPAMLARLEQRLPLLTGGARDTPARQQTLEAAIAWSYELLEPEHQRLFAELGVFNGGRALDAIEAVCDSTGERDVLTSVEALCDSSLLNQQQDADGEARFVMLETIHEYARTRLEELLDADELRRSHALYFHGLAQEGSFLQRKGGLAVGARLRAEIDNLRLALDWFGEHGEPELELEMAANLSHLWRGWGLLREGSQRLEQAMSAASPDPSRARFLALLGLAAIRQAAGEPLAGLSLNEDALDVARALGDDALVMRGVNNLGLGLLAVGRYAEGDAQLQEAAGLAETLDDEDGLLQAHANLVWAALTQQHWEEARTRCERVLELATAEGSEYLIALDRCNLGWALVNLGDEDAERQFLLSLEHTPSYGPRETAECLSGLAAVAASDRPEHAAQPHGSRRRDRGHGGRCPRAIRPRDEREDRGGPARVARRRGVRAVARRGSSHGARAHPRTAADAVGSRDGTRGLPARRAPVRAFARSPPRAPERAPGRRGRDLGEAGGRELGSRVRRQQGSQARVPRSRRARAGLRHARLDRRCPVQPHSSSRGGRREARPRLRARAGALGGLGRAGLRVGRQHPSLPDHGRRRPAVTGRLRHRRPAELGGSARVGARRRWPPVPDPSRSVRSSARRARVRALGRRGRRPGGRRSASSSTRSSSAP